MEISRHIVGVMWIAIQIRQPICRVQNFAQFLPKTGDFRSYQWPSVDIHTGNFGSISFRFFNILAKTSWRFEKNGQNFNQFSWFSFLSVSYVLMVWVGFWMGGLGNPCTYLLLAYLCRSMLPICHSFSQPRIFSAMCSLSLIVIIFGTKYWQVLKKDKMIASTNFRHLK